MKSINPYLNFNGNTEEVFNFYKSIFGGDFAALMRFGEMPGCDEMSENKISDEDKSKIMHIALPIGDGVLMATDALESMGQVTTDGNNYSIATSAESREEADRIFNGLSDGGTVEMPLADAFWGDYFGMLKDRFGVQWMVSFDGKN
jgi:PhnB protein